ncbi:tetratricopeptide repeat protein [uncultured Maribacter sp.]|uniref:tetratricopeptide repeat protein n=1 Tax=uncultured Maribacter sp. TaxID=431308 RepID=UPI0030DACAE5|tara:strand:+ start:811 stop:2712 length:1902 start_codon:yes stop_codon:yes gene_type:complete
MKPTEFTILILLFSGIWLQAQDRQKELDSLIHYAASLPEDTLKAKVLSRIHERMMFMDNEKAFIYAKQAQDLSGKIGYKKGVANGYLQFGNYYYNQSRNDSASFYHNLALKEFKNMNSVKGQIFALHSLATIEREKGDFDNAIELTNSILEMYTDENRKNTDLGNFDLRGSEYEVLGGIYFEKGNYRIALENTLKSLRFFEGIDDIVRKGDALKQLADIEYQLGNYKTSLEYALEAITIYERNDDKIYHSFAANAAGLAAEQLKDLPLARNLLQESIQLAREMNIRSMIAQNLNGLARLDYNEQNFKRAETYLDESIQIAQQEDIKFDLTEAHKEMANLNIAKNNYKLALKSINEVIQIAREIEALPTLRDALMIRANIRNKLNYNDLAYLDLNEFQALNDSLLNERKTEQIEELKTIYKIEKKEAEIALQKEEIKTLNEKAKVDKLTKGLYAGGMASALALFVISVFGFRQRTKKNRIAREKQEEIYKQEIEHKRKELASQTLHLVQKNTFIQELMDNLENIKNSPEKFKMEFRRIVMLLKKENASDKDWEIFKTYFADVHNDFDQKLKTLYADISEKEIRLAAFLRMNLTTKEIAATLNVLPDSILKSKYRLKKKLGLDKKTDLTSFLNTL